MTVSIPKPNWRAVQGLRERAVNTLRRDSASAPAGVGDARTRATRAREWSEVMRGQSQGTAGPAAKAATRSAPPAKAARAARASSVGRWRGEVNTSWVLLAMLLVVCLTAVGWLFAHGTAATFWLVALIAVGFGGVPIGLLVLRLFGYDDAD
jgi:hypothetical protein